MFRETAPVIEPANVPDVDVAIVSVPAVALVMVPAIPGRVFVPSNCATTMFFPFKSKVDAEFTRRSVSVAAVAVGYTSNGLDTPRRTVPPLITRPLPPVKYWAEFRTSVPSPALTTPFVESNAPVRFKVLEPTVQISVVIAPLLICGTFKFEDPDSSKIPPLLTVSLVKSGAPETVPREPPLSKVKLFRVVLAVRVPREERPTFCVAVALVSELTDNRSSVEGLSARRVLFVRSRTKKPLPSPEEEESTRMSGRMESVVVPLMLLAPAVPPPWAEIPGKAGGDDRVMAAVPEPASEAPRLSPRRSRLVVFS